MENLLKELKKEIKEGKLEAIKNLFGKELSWQEVFELFQSLTFEIEVFDRMISRGIDLSKVIKLCLYDVTKKDKNAPVWMSKLVNIEELDLKQTFIEELDISKLTKLKLIYLPDYLKSVPAALATHEVLYTLEVKPHLIPGLARINPSKLDGLIVNYYKTDLVSVPKGIGDLKSLTYLNLSYNKIESLPKEIASLENLECLRLSSNALESIPVEIASMQNLRTLELYENKKLRLPKEFLEMKNLDKDSTQEIKKHIVKEVKKADPTLSKIFAGQKWCVTGTFKNYKPREEALDIIESMGGEVGKSVDKTTTHLLAGEKAGDKIEKAKKLNVQIVTEDEFVELIDPKNASKNLARNKKAATWNEAGASFLKELRNSMKGFAEDREAKLNANKIPQRYKDFLETGEYVKYESMHREFYDEPHKFKFTDRDLISEGVSDEFYDSLLEFAEQEYGNEEKAYMIWPFSELIGPQQSSSICLFIDLTKPECPIYIFEETDIREVEPSLDKFLASLKSKKK